MPDVSLELLQQMVQRVLDGQEMLRRDVRNVGRRMSFLEHAMASLQHTDADRTEAETELEDLVESLSARIERLEHRPS